MVITTRRGIIVYFSKKKKATEKLSIFNDDEDDDETGFLKDMSFLVFLLAYIHKHTFNHPYLLARIDSTPQSLRILFNHRARHLTTRNSMWIFSE